MSIAVVFMDATSLPPVGSVTAKHITFSPARTALAQVFWRARFPGTPKVMTGGKPMAAPSVCQPTPQPTRKSSSMVINSWNALYPSGGLMLVYAPGHGCPQREAVMPLLHDARKASMKNVRARSWSPETAAMSQSATIGSRFSSTNERTCLRQATCEGV
eukprot:CAMPEP_0117546142 /NCGR_PEP_ID=MMETSP0784-20121206/46456_1 /TAXON_ID=39447 /ORGANISM="" /LENGTH=158 /DNA_ID=CAMNT_0005343007 /DNA_START=731 /DNA_END=1207 /DNA_ORIENTATION=-